MKFLAFFAILVVAFVAYTQAQCSNQPSQPNCQGGLHAGRGGSGCHGGTRWYYNRQSGRCVSFQYHGCGGNFNRYCSLAQCNRSCL